MKTFIVLLLSVSILVIIFQSGCITNSDDLSIVLFSAEPTTIQPGETTTISWMVTGATTVSIEPLIGLVDLIGNETVMLNQTTTFTIVANSTNGTIQKSIDVVVQNMITYDSIIIDNQLYQNAKRDPVDIINVTINTDLITFDVGYSGGCENHTFQLVSNEMFMESDPVQIDVVLSHDNNDDVCEAYIYETLVFNLTPLKQKWQDEYNSESGIIILRIENHTETINYQFGTDLRSFLNVTILTNKEVYGINETIDVSILVENKKSSDVILEFPSSKIADFTCMNASGDIVYRWSYDRMFLTVITPVTIPAESTIEIFNTSWSRMGNDGMVLKNGTYILQGFIPGFYYHDGAIDYSEEPGPTIFSEPVEIIFV